MKQLATMLMTLATLGLPHLSTLPGVAATTAQIQCIPTFPLKQGWLGGDGIYSVPLSSGKTVWLFGDTFLNPADPQAKTRAGAGMVANTIAVSNCGPEGFGLDYHWRRKADGSAAAFFEPPGPSADLGPDHLDPAKPAPIPGHKYWPIHGIEQNGRLYIALEDVSVSEGPENGFNFAIADVTLAEIANPNDAPESWQIRYRPLSPGGESIPGIAMIKHEGWLYLLSVREDATKKHPLTLARLPLRALSEDAPLPDRLSHLSRTGAWLPGGDGPEARILAAEAATEASLHYDARRREWLIVHTMPGLFKREIVVRKAPALEGPWDAGLVSQPFYTEMLPAWYGYDRNSFCYAAKAHPAFSSSHGLLITYACNSLSFETLLQRPDLYRPVVRILPLPKS